MNKLFLEDKLKAAIVACREARRDLIEPELFTEEGKRKEAELQIQLEILRTFLRVNELVEYGEDSSHLNGKRLMGFPEVVRISASALAYLEPQRLIEVSLVSNLNAFSQEPAVLLMFQGNEGTIACLHGLRYITYDTFAAKNSKNSLLAEQMICNVVIRPIRVGMNDMVIYTVPVFRPSQEAIPLVDIPSRINYHLHPFKQDGFIQWDQELVRVSIFSLFSRDKWWEINPI